MKLNVGAKTDRGRLSDHNEDYLLRRDDLGLYLVADGVGGLQAGEFASSVGCRLIERALDASASAPPPRHDSVLANAIRQANLGLFELGQQHGGKRGIGTTLVALWFHGDRVLFAYVGDSRVYLYRDGVLTQLSRDEKVGKYHLAASLGQDRAVDVRLGMMRLRPRDRFLLCTDGLHGPVPREDLITLLDSNPDPAQCCERLVARANECGGPDNITAVVADVEEPDPPQAWRFGHVRHEATALLPRLFRPWMLGAAAAGLAAALLLWAVIALVPRTESHSGPMLSSRITALAAEARSEANAGRREAAREALKDLVREAIRTKARFEPAILRLGDAAAEFDAAANAIWTDLYTRVGEKLAELTGTPAARYVDAELNATLARIQTIHDQFHTGDYTNVDATFAILPKQVAELVERGKADFAAERDRIVQDIERLRAKSREFEAGNPIRAALEDHVAEAARALGLGDLAKARREVDLARKQLTGGSEP